MFCYKCGKQIRDDAVFCHYCGTKQSASSDSTTVDEPNVVGTSSNCGELDRAALKIYLRNLLSLECIKANYERKIRDFTCNIQDAKKYNAYIKRYDALPNQNISAINEYFFFRYNGALSFWGYSSCSVPDGHLNGEGKWWRIDKDSDIDYLKKANEWNWNHYAHSCAGFFERREQWANARDTFFRAYAEFKKEAPTIYQNTMEAKRRDINTWQQKIKGMTKELQEVNQLLRKTYAINIVPSQFRYKIHAIYFLYDFVSTSRESLTTAMLHFDLDVIKTKLDRIIAQQENIIVQNAVRIAQNNTLIQKNQQQLEVLSRIESSTSQAAQYAQIAASNAETCAWISMAKYIEAHR